MTRAALAILLCAAATGVQAETRAPLPAPEFIGQIVVPSGLSIGGVGFGGISDLAYDAATNRYLAISDDRAEFGPARFYDLRIDVAEGVVRLDIAGMTALQAPGGGAFAAKAVDAEGIAFDGTRLFWTSERDAQGRPQLFTSAPDGTGTTELPLPAAHIPDADGTRGIYGNLGHEALTLSPDGNQLILITENGLAQDGDKATLTAGSPARLLVMNAADGAHLAEFIYQTEPIFAAATVDPFWNDNGVTAVHALADGRLVVVERSFALGVGNMIRLFVADPTGATSILGQEKVDLATTVPVTKTPWFQISEGDFGLNIDNIEGLAFGPVVDGRQLVVLAADNNFNAADQATQIVVFGIPPM